MYGISLYEKTHYSATPSLGPSLVTGDEGAREVEGVPALVHHTLDAVRIRRCLGVDVSHRSGSHSLGPPLPRNEKQGGSNTGPVGMSKPCDDPPILYTKFYLQYVSG